MKREISYYSPHHKKILTAYLIEANWFWKKYFKLTGFGGITLPNRKIVVLPEFMHYERLISHELAHVEQYERMGTVKFLVSYFLLMVRYGYEKHPYEIEARRKSTRL